MKILVWGINYAPEATGIGPCNTALCEHLRAAGHEVEMVTTFSYYPAWRKRAEDRGVIWRSETVNGVLVHRCWHYVPSRVRWWRRIIHEATFVLTSLPRVLIRPRPEVLITISPPLLLGPASWLVSLLRATRYVFHVQDLQPDAAVGVGLLRDDAFTRSLYAVEAFAYRHAWQVSGISRGMLTAFSSKGVPPERQLYFPNGIRLEDPPVRGAFRARQGMAENDFLAVYSGNIGVKQGVQLLVRAVRLVRGQRIRLVICGDGAQRYLIETEAAGLENVRLLPLLPDAEYREMLADCDIAVIPQLAGSGRAFFPSKLLNPLAYGCPILSVADADSELARVVAEGGFGCNVPPGEPASLAETLDRLAADPGQLAAWGKAGRTWVAQFEQTRVLEEFSENLRAKFATA
ncbi:colanic acid biosynthesis glycosyl transferase WcaI [Chthoniobacter flavus]|uniref:WcaI family glycosyltransferase n=1 Tax=Chthoniobacter flavus TaxID=191863 RepID=UPI001046F860|nr:WcaI family glycosyltransferase [Chthoniobacter flavus]TCO92860.1 colanic acid biosynthesis glycosyl transferase WcaI [Chthoniobacter flavus]